MKAKLLSLKKHFDTLKDIEKIQELNKNDIESYLIESDILIKDNDPNKALEAIDNGLKENNNNFELYKKKWKILYDQGLNHKDKKDFRDAKLCFNSILNDINEYIKINGEKYELLKARVQYTDRFIVKNRLGVSKSNDRFSLEKEITIFPQDFFIKSESRKSCNDYNIFIFIETVNKCILLNDKDAELHYLLAKYATSIRYSPYYKDELKNSVASYLEISPIHHYHTTMYHINGYSSYEIHMEYNQKFYGGSNEWNSNISISTILKHLDDALVIKPDYEEALLLKGLIYRIQQNNQALLALRDEYVKQGFEPDKIFNKLFND